MEIRAKGGRFHNLGLSLQNSQVTNWGLGGNRARFQHIVTTTKNHRGYTDVV